MKRNSIKALTIGLFTAGLIFIAADSGICAAEKPEIFVQIGHSDWVSSVAFSPDGRCALSGSGDHTMKLWDIATGKEIRTFKGNTSEVLSIAFSPDGRYALSGNSDNTMKLWDVTSGRQIRTFKGHSSIVESVAFSPDGRYALSGGDTTLKLWDVATGKQIRTFEGHTDSVKSVAFSPDGRYALSGAEQGRYDTTNNMKLWDIATGKEIRTFGEDGDGNEVSSVAFSPDGRYALSGSEDRTIRLWDVATGKNIKSFTGHDIKSNYSDVSSVAFSKDGRYALAGRVDNIVDLWDITTGKEIRTFTGHTWFVHSVAFSPDGHYALSGSSDMTMKLWDVATGKEIRTYNGDVMGSEDSFVRAHNDRHAVFSPDGHYALSGNDNNHNLELWDVATGKQIRTFKGHSSWISSVTFSPDGKYALSGSGDQTLKLWEITTGKEIRTFRGHSGYIESAAFPPDGKYAISGTDDGLKYWEVATGKEIRTFKGGHSVAFSPDGRYLLSGSKGDNNTLRLWDVATGKEIRDFREHTGSNLKIIESVVFSPDGRYILIARFDNILTLREVATGKQIRTFKGHSSWVSSVTFSPDGKYALSGSGDQTVKLWEVATGKELWTFRGHSGHVESVAFSPDGKYAISGSDDKTLRIWKIATGTELGQFVSFADGEWVAITSDGYFNASTNGAKHINVRIDNKVYPIDDFYGKYFNPVYVASVLQGKTTASFDCSKTLSKVENLICNNPGLTDLDVKLNEAYKNVLDIYDLDPRQRIASEQELWQKNKRDMCDDEQCLKNAYSARIEAINALFNKHNSSKSQEPYLVADLCNENEEVLFSCQAKSKIISLCASADASATKGYLLYRYGRVGHSLELEYPSKSTPPAKAFRFARDSGSKGGAEELSFSTGGYVYTLYSDHWGGLAPEQYDGVFVEKGGRRIANIRCNDDDQLLADMYYIGVDESHFSDSKHFIGLPSSGKIRTDMFE